MVNEIFLFHLLELLCLFLYFFVSSFLSFMRFLSRKYAVVRNKTPKEVNPAFIGQWNVPLSLAQAALSLALSLYQFPPFFLRFLLTKHAIVRDKTSKGSESSVYWSMKCSSFTCSSCSVSCFISLSVSSLTDVWSSFIFFDSFFTTPYDWINHHSINQSNNHFYQPINLSIDESDFNNILDSISFQI